MLVPPAGWSNPAAHAQQGLSTQRFPSTATNTSASPQLSPIEQSQKTGDRDANERYDGPMPHRSKNHEDSEAQDGLNHLPSDPRLLPADDGEVSQIDFSG